MQCGVVIGNVKLPVAFAPDGPRRSQQPRASLLHDDTGHCDAWLRTVEDQRDGWGGKEVNARPALADAKRGCAFTFGWKEAVKRRTQVLAGLSKLRQSLQARIDDAVRQARDLVGVVRDVVQRCF